MVMLGKMVSLTGGRKVMLRRGPVERRGMVMLQRWSV